MLIFKLLKSFTKQHASKLIHNAHFYPPRSPTRIDPFLRKEWYAIKAPTYFAKRVVGVMPVTKTTGQKTARDSLLGRKVSLPVADLANKGDEFRKFSLKVDDVQGIQCLTSFAGMTLTTDKVRSLIRKRQSMVEVAHDVKTTDGYVLRVFVVGFTKRQRFQKKATTYAQTGHIQKLRRRAVAVIQKEVSSSDVTKLVTKLANEVIGRQVEALSQSIYPLQNVLTYKVKVLRSPKSDAGRLMQLHGGSEAVVAFQREFEAAAALQGSAPAERAEETVVEEITA
jgi:small subunit ribosomal protein S3Ae